MKYAELMSKVPGWTYVEWGFRRHRFTKDTVTVDIRSRKSAWNRILGDNGKDVKIHQYTEEERTAIYNAQPWKLALCDEKTKNYFGPKAFKTWEDGTMGNVISPGMENTAMAVCSGIF